MFPQTPGPIGLFDSGYGGLMITFIWAITHVLLMEPVRSRSFINLPVRRYRVCLSRVANW